MQKRIIISGGGTGGHIFPAIAIADEFKRRYPEAEVLFVGAHGRMEMEKIPQAGYQIIGLDIAGIQRGSILKNITLPFKLIGSLLKAFQVVQSFKPQVAVGVGGYASGPLLRVASFLNIKTLIQEQNSFAGLTNKILSKKANVICTGYKEMGRFFPAEKTVYTGNPVRQAILNQNITKEEGLKQFGLDNNRKTILVVGGSLGARTINRAIEFTLDKIKHSAYQVLWQTGKAYYDECCATAKGIPNVHVHQFIEKMDFAYAAADIIISRAGALAISELQIVGKPVILVPSPNVAEDHQTHNAMTLVNNQAAILIKDDEAKLNLTGAAFDLLNDEATMQRMAHNIRKMAMPDATKRIVDEIEKLL